MSDGRFQLCNVKLIMLVAVKNMTACAPFPDNLDNLDTALSFLDFGFIGILCPSMHDSVVLTDLDFICCSTDHFAPFPVQ